MSKDYLNQISKFNLNLHLLLYREKFKSKPFFGEKILKIFSMVSVTFHFFLEVLLSFTISCVSNSVSSSFNSR
mgnify:CR=1 FL=1